MPLNRCLTLNLKDFSKMSGRDKLRLLVGTGELARKHAVTACCLGLTEGLQIAPMALK